MSNDKGKFFLVVPVDMERIALYELHRVLENLSQGLPTIEFFPGGLELELPLSVGYALNRMLRVPVRILLRVAEAEVKNFDEFQKFLIDAKMERFAPLGDVHVSSRSSFLRIKEDLERKTKKFLKYQPKKNGTDIFVRFFRDVCTLSVNTSGEDLYRRGYDKWVGEAPVRDNIAAALVEMTLKGIEPDVDLEIIDPMAGSGTFLLEAHLLGRMLTRSYAFENWNKKEANNTVTEPYLKNVEYYAYDKAKKNTETLKHNLSILQMHGKIVTEDLFAGDALARTQKRRIVMVNPPYGKRLKTSGTNDYFNKILEQIIKKFEPDRVGLLTPRVWLENSSLEKIYTLDFKNSGIETRFSLFVR